MPRASSIAQADIARTLRAFKGLGVEAEVRIMADGSVIVSPVPQKIEDRDAHEFDKGGEIRL